MRESVALLRALVAEPTVSNRPVLSLAALLAERAEARGLRATVYETSPGKVNVVARGGPEGVGGLTLCGHMDVVPPDGQDWSRDPFTLFDDGERLYGRGSCDMKGFLAAVDEALGGIDVRALRQELALVWTHDEEVGCLGAAALVSALQAEGRSLPRATLIGEPTGFRVCRLHPGHVTFTLEARGRAAHSSRPALGYSAVGLGARAVLALEALAADLRQETAFVDDLPTPHPVLNVGRIQGGTAVNIVPDACSIAFGIRPLPGQSVDALEARVHAALGPLADEARAAGGSLTLTRGHHTPALLTHADCAHAALLAPWASSPRATGAPFATDGGQLARLGVEVLVCGPGSIDDAHRPDESIAHADLARGVEMVQDLVRRRCLVPAAPAA